MMTPAMLVFDHHVDNSPACIMPVIGSEHFVPLVHGDIRIVLGQDDSGITVEYMDGAKYLHRLCNKFLLAGLIGYILCDGNHILHSTYP